MTLKLLLNRVRNCVELRFNVAIKLYEKPLQTSLHGVTNICKPLVVHNRYITPMKNTNEQTNK